MQRFAVSSIWLTCAPSARCVRAGWSPALPRSGPDSCGRLGGGDESGPLPPNELRWHVIIEVARLTKGLQATRVDALGSVQ
jgi:hypothetical protein